MQLSQILRQLKSQPILLATHYLCACLWFLHLGRKELLTAAGSAIQYRFQPLLRDGLHFLQFDIKQALLSLLIPQVHFSKQPASLSHQ